MGRIDQLRMSKAESLFLSLSVRKLFVAGFEESVYNSHAQQQSPTLTFSHGPLL